jgi:hypothetical protein
MVDDAAMIPAVVSVAAIVAAAIISVTVPGAGTDKYAAREPLRTIVPIRSAGVRRVPVVPIGARGRTVRIAANTNAHGDLSVRGGRRAKKQSEDCEYCEIFE